MSAVDQGRFSETVRNAVDAAAADVAPGHAVDTRDVLLALMRIDARGEWDRVALHFVDDEAVRRAPVVDPRADVSHTWGTSPLSGTCAAALTLAVQLADSYETDHVSVGLATIAIVADPASAAAMALTSGDPGRHAELLELLQETVVGESLGGLTDALRQGRESLSRVDTPSGRVGGPEVPGLNDDGDSLDLLAAALDAVEDDKLGQTFERMLLDAEAVREVRPFVAGLPTVTVADIVERAKRRFDAQRPDARQLIATATSNPCERLAKALRLLGVQARSVAFEAAMANARANRIGTEISNPTYVYTILNFILSLTVTLLVVRRVMHDWWPGILIGLAVIYMAWTGHIVTNVVMIGLAWIWLGPQVGVAAVLLAFIDLLLSWSERRNALKRTGMWVSTTEWRRHVRLRRASQAVPVAVAVGMRRRRRLARAARSRA